MKFSKINLTVFFSGLLFIAPSIAQNTNVVSAALEFQKYEPALMQQKIDEAKGHLLSAKSFIDPAMQNEITKNDAKAHYYNVVINFGLMEISGFAEDESLKIYQSDSIIDVISNSIKIASSKKRWKGEVEEFFNKRVSQALMIAEMMYKQHKYSEAFMGFAGAYQYKKIGNIEEDQETMKVNAIIAARYYIDTLKKQDEADKALEFISSVLELFPESEEIAIDGINLALEKEDLTKAEEYFDLVAEASPDNKVLFSNMGSIYLTQADKAQSEFSEMNITDGGYQQKSDEVEGLYSKAEQNLRRAIEIDGNYAEASYNLGVLYLNRGEKLRIYANQMDFNNPDYDKVTARSKEMYEKAIDPLESYIKQDPNNVGVLNVLFQVHRNVGNNEKALEYKKRAEEIQEK